MINQRNDGYSAQQGDGTVREAIPVINGDLVFSPKHINTSATTLVKTGAGVLHGVTINTKATTSVTTVYDSLTASGTVIAVLDSTNNVGSFLYDVAFTIGLTVVTTGTPDLTVSYR